MPDDAPADLPAPDAQPDPAALLAAALKKSEVLWLLPAGADTGGRAFTFHADADGVWMLTGDGEQPAGPLHDADRVGMVLRSHDSQSGRVVTADAQVRVVDLEDPAAQAPLAALSRTRLNSLGPSELLARWRTAGVVLHLLAPVPRATPEQVEPRVPTRLPGYDG